MSATDTLGMRLFREDMSVIWEEQKRYVACLQDPGDVPLYTRCGSTRKGDLVLSVYRCARGSTSLESFHLHLARFIPGTSANPLNFQAYLLDGLMRWNEARQTAAIVVDVVKVMNTKTVPIYILRNVLIVSKIIAQRTNYVQCI